MRILTTSYRLQSCLHYHYIDSIHIHRDKIYTIPLFKPSGVGIMFSRPTALRPSVALLGGSSIPLRNGTHGHGHLPPLSRDHPSSPKPFTSSHNQHQHISRTGIDNNNSMTERTLGFSWTSFKGRRRLYRVGGLLLNSVITVTLPWKSLDSTVLRVWE
jgi:hypothetical protein